MHRAADRLDRRQHPLRAATASRPAASSTTPISPCRSRSASAVGTATINEFDDASLERVVRRAEELAQAGAGKSGVHAGDREADLQAERHLRRHHRRDHAGIPRQGRRRLIGAVQGRQARRRRLPSPTARASRRSPTARATSATRSRPALDFTCTVRTDDGRGSGWVARNLGDVDKFDADERHPDRHAEGQALGRRQGARARQVHRDPGTGRGGRADLAS